jgi:hypothetical protein
MEDKIMFAELIDGVTIEMLNDPLVRIVSDTGVFLITRESNISNYPELDFEETDEKALKTYKITF